MISLSKVSAIFNFQITWASNPISLANWLIWVSPIHTFLERNLPFEAKNIKHDRYFRLGLAWLNSRENSAAHERKQLSKLPRQASFLLCVADFKRIPTIKNFTLAIKNFTLRPPSKKNKIVTIQYFHRLEEKPWVRG